MIGHIVLRPFLIAAIGAVVIDLATGSQLSIVGEPKSADVIPGESVDLHCEAFGTPVPTIQWLKDGKVVRQGSPSPLSLKQKKFTLLSSPVVAERMNNRGIRTFQMSTTSSKIHIPCVSRDSIGSYTCVASNGRETVTANATVKVAEKSNALLTSNDCPRKRSEGKPDAAPAQIYMWTDSRMERPGVSVQLMCRSAGNPPPKTVWYESSDPDGDADSLRPIFSDDPRYAVLSNGDLLVKETPADVAVSMFQCKVANEYGKDSITSMLLEITDDTAEENVDEAIQQIEEQPSRASDEERGQPMDTVFPL